MKLHARRSVCYRPHRRMLSLILKICVCVFVTSSPVLAQVGANLGGTVKDSTGATVPGATVTVVNTRNGVSQTQVTGADGTYRAVNLQPAPYEVTVALQGFQTVKKAVTLLVGSDQTVDFTLGLANVSENITVAGEAPLVEVTKSQPASVIDERQVAALPVLSRNFLVLAQTMPSAAPITNLAVSGRFAFTKFGGLADQRSGFTTIIDGSPIDDAIWGAPTINLSQDAVQEFKVYRNQFDAQYGSAMNAVINVVSKSGGENVHGTGYYFGRDQALDATNALAGTTPPFRQARAGGTIGGPLGIKNTHYFGSYEGLNVRTAFIEALPASNPFAAQENGNYPFTITENMADVKVDHQFGASHSFYLRYAYDNQFTPSGGPPESSNTQTDNNHSHDVLMEDNWILSSNKVNTFRFDFLKQNLYSLPANNNVGISRPSFSFGQTFVDPQYFPRKDVAIFDTLFLNLGKHDIKLGGEFRHAISNYDAHYYERGVFYFSTDAPFDLNDPKTYPYAMRMETPGNFSYVSNQIAAFAQDDWHAGEHLTLNLGLRWDMDTNLRDNSFWYGLLKDAAFAGLDNFVTTNRGHDWTDIQPRVGVSWDASGNGKFVVHGGVGRYVSRNRPWFQQQAEQQTLGAAAYIQDPAQLANFPSPTAVLGGKSLAEYVAAGAARYAATIPDGFVPPSAWNLTGGFGWQASSETSLSVGVVHNHSVNELGSADMNLPATGVLSKSNPRPVPQFSQVAAILNSGEAWYDALETELQTRIKGLDLLKVSYTYSKSMLNGVTFYSTYSGTQRTPDDYAYNPTDTPHNLSVSFVSAMLPGAFTVSGMFRAISGGPLPVQAGFDLDGDGQPSGDRPKGLPQTVGHGDVNAQLLLINAFRANPCGFVYPGVSCNKKPLPPIARSLLNIDPTIELDARLTKVLRLSDTRRVELFFEGFNLTNHVTLYNGNSSMTASSFLIRTRALPERQLQWGARVTF